MSSSDWWVKMRIDLRDEPEVQRIARLLRIDPDAVVGKLLAFWGWVKRASREASRNGVMDRHISGVTRAFIDDKVRHTGFALALESVGWLCVTGEDEITVPCAGKYLSKASEDKADAAERARRYRERLRVTQPRDASRARSSRKGRDQRREDKNNTPPTPSKGDARNFEKFWSAYPRKINRNAAERAWNEINPDETLTADILAALGRLKESRKWRDQDGRFIPAPSKWLRDCRWEEAGPVGESTAARVRRIQAEMAARRKAEPSLSPEEIRERLRRANATPILPPQAGEVPPSVSD